MELLRGLYLLYFLLVLLKSELVRSDFSDEECELVEDVELPENPSDRTSIKKVYKGKPRSNQKSLLIIFDGTGSMRRDLVQLREGAREIVKAYSQGAENPIYNYVLSVFRDPGEINLLKMCKIKL